MILHIELKDQPILYDVYLSFNVHDEQLANVVVEKLTEKHSEIKIYAKHQELNSEESWQEEIYKVNSFNVSFLLHQKSFSFTSSEVFFLIKGKLNFDSVIFFLSLCNCCQATACHTIVKKNLFHVYHILGRPTAIFVFVMKCSKYEMAAKSLAILLSEIDLFNLFSTSSAITVRNYMTFLDSLYPMLSVFCSYNFIRC